MAKSSTPIPRFLLMSIGLGFGAVIGGCQAGPGPDAQVHAERPARGMHGRYDRPGYVTYIRNGQLWVFDAQSEALQHFQREGEPSRSVTLVGVGPDGMNVRSVTRETIEGYLAADGR